MIELVAKTIPQIDDVSTGEFAAYVARIGKIKENPEKLTKFLLKHKHFSPFEHTYFTFKIRTSRAIGRELLRHRSFTFQELSQRYEKVLEFEPIELRKQSENNRQSSEEVYDPTLIWYQQEPYQEGFDSVIIDSDLASNCVDNALNLIKDLYTKLLEAGVARECARMILPECTSTTILMTGNLRSWIHFLAIRNDERAQKEMQLLAKEIEKFLSQEVPIMFNND